MTWERIKLSDCCLSIADGDHQAPPKAENGIAFVTISSIVNNSLCFDSVMHVPVDYYHSLDSKRTAQPGDVLYSVVGSFGIPVLVKEDWPPFVFQRHIAILRPSPIIDARFLYYSMLSKDFYAQADAAAIGAAQRTISLSALRNLQISLPPIQQQRRIADILSAYDDLIENNQKQIKLLEEAAQRLYKEWFVDLRFPGHETTPIIDGVPDGWTRGAINSLIELQSGFAFKSDDFCSNGTYKIVTIKNVQDGWFDGRNVSTIANIPSKMPTHCKLYDNDILLSLTGNVGRVCIFNGDNYLLNQRVAKIKSAHPSFAYCLFRYTDMFIAMANLANGAAQQNLSPIKVGQMCILIPSQTTLAHFEKIASPIINRIVHAAKQIGLLQQARDRLLPKLMSGEIEV